jgi:hypothetical protein
MPLTGLIPVAQMIDQGPAIRELQNSFSAHPATLSCPGSASLPTASNGCFFLDARLVQFHPDVLLLPTIKVCLLIPTVRISSATGTPASACSITAAIYSTENRFFFMANLSAFPRLGFVEG